MGAVGDYDHLAVAFPPVLMVGLDNVEAGQLSMGAGGGLQRNLVNPTDLAEILIQLIHHLKGALAQLLRLIGMDIGKPRQPDDLFIDLGIILHGAGPQRVEVNVNPVVQL